MMKKRFLLLAFLLFIPWTIKAQTLSQIRTEVRRNIRDTASDSSRYKFSDSLLTDLANNAQREIVNATWLCDKTSTYVLLGRTTYYDLPNDLIAIFQVEFKNSGGQTIELNETSLKQLYDKNPDWTRQTGTPVEYVVRQPTSTATTALSISYIPIPTNTSTGTVTIRYYNQVADLSADADIPYDGRRHLYPYHYAIVDHVTARIKLIEGRSDEATLYIQLFQNDISVLRDRIGRAPNYNPSFGVGTHK